MLFPVEGSVFGARQARLGLTGDRASWRRTPPRPRPAHPCARLRPPAPTARVAAADAGVLTSTGAPPPGNRRADLLGDIKLATAEGPGRARGPRGGGIAWSLRVEAHAPRNQLPTRQRPAVRLRCASGVNPRPDSPRRLRSRHAHQPSVRGEQSSGQHEWGSAARPGPA